jgi:hypothetical protein
MLGDGHSSSGSSARARVDQKVEVARSLHVSGDPAALERFR